MKPHSIRDDGAKLGDVRNADGNPCPVCSSPRVEELVLDDGGARLWEVERCRKCNPNAVEAVF